MLSQEVKRDNDRSNETRDSSAGGKIYIHIYMRGAIHRSPRRERVSHLVCARNDATNRRTLRRSE